MTRSNTTATSGVSRMIAKPILGDFFSNNSFAMASPPATSPSKIPRSVAGRPNSFFFTDMALLRLSGREFIYHLHNRVEGVFARCGMLNDSRLQSHKLQAAIREDFYHLIAAGNGNLHTDECLDVCKLRIQRVTLHCDTTNPAFADRISSLEVLVPHVLPERFSHAGQVVPTLTNTPPLFFTHTLGHLFPYHPHLH